MTASFTEHLTNRCTVDRPRWRGQAERACRRTWSHDLVTSTAAGPRTRPEVVAFDVNEPLLALAPVGAALVELGQPEHLLPVVFGRTLLTGFAATVAGTWCRFRE